MRGFPPLQIFFCLLAFVGFAVPLARLTFARPSPQTAVSTAVAPPPVEMAQTTHIRLRFAHLPSEVSLKIASLELIPVGTAPSLEMEFTSNFPIPNEGIEVAIDATWPEGTPDTAVTVELEPDGLDTQSQTRWSSAASLADFIPFHWKL